MRVTFGLVLLAACTTSQSPKTDSDGDSGGSGSTAPPRYVATLRFPYHADGSASAFTATFEDREARGGSSSTPSTTPGEYCAEDVFTGTTPVQFALVSAGTVSAVDASGATVATGDPHYTAALGAPPAGGTAVGATATGSDYPAFDLPSLLTMPEPLAAVVPADVAAGQPLAFTWGGDGSFMLEAVIAGTASTLNCQLYDDTSFELDPATLALVGTGPATVTIRRIDYGYGHDLPDAALVGVVSTEESFAVNLQ